jgi:hypothetical protein
MSQLGQRSSYDKVAAEEAREEAREEAQFVAQSLQNWRRLTAYVGVAFVASAGSVVPFLYGHSLHNHWDAVGKRIVMLAMILSLAFCYTAGVTLRMYFYLRSVKKFIQEYPPDS